MDKVELVDTNCGLQLWRRLTQEYEPKWKSRRKNCILEKPGVGVHGDAAGGGFHPLWSSVFEANRERHGDADGAPRSAEVELPVPRAGGTAAEIGSVTEGRMPISVSNDSSAKITFWPRRSRQQHPQRSPRRTSQT